MTGHDRRELGRIAARLRSAQVQVTALRRQTEPPLTEGDVGLRAAYLAALAGEAAMLARRLEARSDRRRRERA